MGPQTWDTNTREWGHFVLSDFFFPIKECKSGALVMKLRFMNSIERLSLKALYQLQLFVLRSSLHFKKKCVPSFILCLL